jgi:hypothetical protein
MSLQQGANKGLVNGKKKILATEGRAELLLTSNFILPFFGIEAQW